eukprot:jgi/Tetstr1/431981/TSEL_021458.t1
MGGARLEVGSAVHHSGVDELGRLSVGERAVFFAHRFIANDSEGVLAQAIVVYSIVAVGFLLLYFMMKNTARLNEMRKGMKEVLKAEADRPFSEYDAVCLNRGLGLI